MTLKIASFLSPGAEAFYRFLAEIIAYKLELEPPDFIQGDTFKEFNTQEFDLVFACGFWYVHRAELYDPLVAPVMAATRYQDQPIYFADLIVKQDAPIWDLSQLKGKRFGYNEEYSFSGYKVPLSGLVNEPAYPDFFARVVKTGSHQNSIKAVANSRVDWASLDSTVLEHAVSSLHRQVKVLSSLGPFPAPPLLISQKLSYQHRYKIENTLLGLSSSVLGKFGVKAFDPVSRAFYDQFFTIKQKISAHQLLPTSGE